MSLGQTEGHMDAADEGRWMTFLELSQARGISEASTRKLVRRHKWRRQAGNQGIVRILVPLEALDSPRGGLSVVSGTDLPHDPRPDPSDMQRAVSALEAAVLALREQLERSETGRVRTEQAIVEERSRADRSEQGRDAERARADALRDRVDSLQVQIAALETEGAASDMEATELTAQLRQARCDLQAERAHGEELRKALAETEGRSWWRRWGLLKRR